MPEYEGKCGKSIWKPSKDSLIYGQKKELIFLSLVSLQMCPHKIDYYTEHEKMCKK